MRRPPVSGLATAPVAALARAALVFVAIVATSGCPPDDSGVICNADSDCFVGHVCRDGHCITDFGEGEGEGEGGEGEGEGDPCGTHDEDNDGVADRCDDCPTTSDAAQADSDGDGVGDACDPRPDQGGDVLIAFDAFDGVVLSSAWTGAGSWSLSNDQLHHTATADAEILRRTDIAPTDHIVVELRFTVESFELGGQFNTASAGIGVGMTGDADGVMCFPVIGDGAQALVIDGLVNNDASEFRASSDLASPDQIVGPTLLLRAVLDGSLQCQLEGVATVVDATATPAGGVVLRSNRMVTSFDSFAAWSIGP